MSTLHEKDDVSTNLEAADRIPIYRDTLAAWQLIGLEQLKSPFYSGFPSYGTVRLIMFRDDLLTTGDALTGLVATTNSGTVAASGSATSGRVGTVVLSTSTSSSASPALSSNTSALGLGSGRVRYRWDVRTDSSNLSDGTDTYTLRVGLGDVTTGESTDAVYFRYTHSVNSGKWQAVTISNTTETATDSGVTVAANTWYVLEAEVNAAASSVAFYVNGSLVATNTTNIPSGTSRALCPLCVITKSAGTTSRSLVADLCYFTFEPTTAL